jgi:endonuclease YncB( thermonuclease family)
MKTIEDAPEFSLNYKVFLAKIVKVVDGDTVKAVISLNNTFTRFTFRLNGIDTPESRKGEVKEFGKKVKEIITRMLTGRMVRIEAGDFDKYGRILARIYVFE